MCIRDRFEMLPAELDPNINISDDVQQDIIDDVVEEDNSNEA